MQQQLLWWLGQGSSGSFMISMSNSCRKNILNISHETLLAVSLWRSLWVIRFWGVAVLQQPTVGLCCLCGGRIPLGAPQGVVSAGECYSGGGPWVSSPPLLGLLESQSPRPQQQQQQPQAIFSPYWAQQQNLTAAKSYKPCLGSIICILHVREASWG